jgi:hypothetical protein
MDPLQWLREDMASLKEEVVSLRQKIESLEKIHWISVGKHGVITGVVSFVVATAVSLVAAYISRGH